MPLHTPTLFIVIVALCATLALAMTVMAQRYRQESAFWALSMALLGCGYALFALRGQIPVVLSVVLGNTALAASFASGTYAVQRFHQRYLHLGWLLAPVVFVAVAFYWLRDDLQTRLMLAGPLFALQSAQFISIAWRQRRQTHGRGQYLLMAGIALVALTVLVRSLFLLSGLATIPQASGDSASQAATFLSTITGIVLASFGWVAMLEERADAIAASHQRYTDFRNRILELLSRDTPLPDVLYAIVTGIETMHPDMLCSILQIDRKHRTLEEGAAPSLPGFYNQAIYGLAIGPAVGSCGTAAFTGERVVVDDIQTHPYWVPYKDLAEKAGLRACWSQPIRSSDGVIVGTFAIYHRDIHAPTAADIDLIEQTALLAAIAIDNSHALERLKTSEQRYRRLVENVNEGISVVQDGLVRYVNPTLCELLGYRETDLLGQPSLNYVHPDDRPTVLAFRDRQHAGQIKGESMVLRLLTRHRGVRWFNISGTLFDWDGQTATLYFMADITDRKEIEERVQRMAYEDPLTQLPNRRLLLEHLKGAVAQHRRNGHRGAVMFIDLDNFKPLNDRYGHGVGDLLLVEVARRLRACVREIDTVARLGGDEFVLLLNDLPGDETEARRAAAQVANKALESLSQPYHLTGEAADTLPATIEHHCSASMGVVLFGIHEGSLDLLLQQADSAMYQAKDAGRNTVRFHPSADSTPA